MDQSSTTVVNVKYQFCDIYIGRRLRHFPYSKWGNPFRIGPDGNRAEVLEKYESWLRGQPDLIAALPELRGKRLGCFCHPECCHGDLLARLAEMTEAELQEWLDDGPVGVPVQLMLF